MINRYVKVHAWTIILSILTLVLVGGVLGGESQAAGISAGVMTSKTVSGGGTGACTQRFTDAFTNLSGWQVIDGTIAASGGLLVNTGSILCNTTFSTATQWAIITMSGTTPDITFGFRSDTDGDPSYIVEATPSGTLWYTAGWGSEIEANATTWATGDKFAVMVKGTGTNTVVSVWKSPTNNKPLSGGGSCTNNSQPCWDSAGDAPDFQMTADPSVLSDSLLNFYIVLVAGTADNLYMGDCND